MRFYKVSFKLKLQNNVFIEKNKPITDKIIIFIFQSEGKQDQSYHHLWNYKLSCLMKKNWCIPCQTKVTDFENTIGIDQKISWLDVSVNDFSWMKILDSTKKLIQEDLDVIRGEMLRWNDDLVQVRLHQFCDHVNLLEKVHVWRLK